jgi:probable F420-dependent oxidoreductase
MKFGIVLFPADFGISVLEVGPAVEQRGFESLFFPEHTHIPARRVSPFPRGGELPDYYSHLLDPFVALTAVAATTRHLRVGTGVCLVVERDPIVTAKEVASLDFLSGGRFLFGVGAGWNREEMQNHGTDPRTRMRLMAERVHAMRAIWTQEEASYSGEHVSFDDIWSWPKPAQTPHPPVIVGGTGPTVLDRVLDFGDEWMPNRPDDLGELGRAVAHLQSRAADAGPEPIPVTLFGAPEEQEALARCEEIGITRCLFRVPSTGRDDVLTKLDSLTRLVSDFGSGETP